MTGLDTTPRVEALACTTWEELRSRIAALEAQWLPGTQQIYGSQRSKLLYRGQPDATKPLTTTLERYNPSLTSTVDYFRAINAARSQIEAHTGKHHYVPSVKDYIEWAKNSDLITLTKFHRMGYEYKAHLRHHGCPSPLLDWTRSPYIAAFFAFRNPPPEVTEVALFAYCEFATAFKTSSSGEPSIIGLGPYVSTHARHFLQQCEYTICLEFNSDRQEWLYAPHETAFAYSLGAQDIRWKFTLPVSERDIVMSELDKMNLNAFSLFATEDALVEAIAMRHLRPLPSLHSSAVEEKD